MSLLANNHHQTTMTTSTSTSSMAPNASTLPQPSTVGNSFVKQYYHLLAQSPETLHRFYKDDSKFTHGRGSQDENSISGQKNINDKIMSMGYAGAHVDLESGSVDCQSSLDGGVLVMVAGVMTLKAETPRAFVQTFFLAVQPNGYFVLNDAFRYLETLESKTFKNQSPSPPLPLATTTTTTATAPASPVKSAVVNPKSTIKSNSPVRKNVVVTSPVAPPVVAPASPVKKGWGDIPASPVAAPATVPATTRGTGKEKAQASVAQQPPSSSKNKHQSMAENGATPAKTTKTPTSSAPKSWASHLFMGAKPTSESASGGATGGKKSTSPKASKKSSKSSASTLGWGDAEVSPAVPSSSPASDAEPAAIVSEKPRASVLYLRDLPSHAKESDVLELFSPFGTITGTTVNATKGFAFVDYESFSSVEAALKCCPFKLLDTPIHVEERPPQRDGNRYNNRDGRFSRGRGGNRRDNNNGRGSHGRPSMNTNQTPNTNNMKSSNSTRSRNGSGKPSARAD